MFPLDAIDRLGVFLAVRMNGEPLTPDHGAPVRLVVPGWYGCSWIKWVNELRIVGADEPTTLQMKEFSLRTHQGRIPTLAKDYEPPVIDLAATPIRVEKRRVNGRLQYRVIGIVWGGDRPVDRLAIRFSAGETPRPFTLCPRPRTHADLVALGLPLGAEIAGRLQHRADRRGPLNPHAPARRVVLRPACGDRRSVS